jgi:hypothetical protein
MVNYVLSSQATFYMCSIKIPITILKLVDKYRRHCLWRGEDINATPLGSLEDGHKAKAQRWVGCD